MRLLLQRYLAANFVLPLLVSLLFFVTFLLTFELFRLTALLMSRDTSLVFLLSLLGDIALTFIPLALPIATFFSVVFCLNRLSNDAEYVAMRAAGLTKGRLFSPFFLVSLLAAVSVFLLAQEVIPYTNRDFKRRVNFLTSSGLISAIKQGQFFTAINGVTLFPTKAGERGRGLEGVFLHVKEEKSSRVIIAKRGELIYERDSNNMVERLALGLEEGTITGLRNGTEVEKILFRRYFMPLSQSTYSERISPRETMLAGRELHAALRLSEEEAREKYNFTKRDMFNAQYEYWNRFNTPVLCLLLTLLGFGLGVKEGRGRGRNSAVWGLTCLLVFYGLFFALVGAARGGKLPMPVAMLVPDVLLLGAGIFFYRKLDWNS
jgi:lipopolysaccharide export system permease protein